MKNARLGLLAISGLLSSSLLIGAGTFALYSTNAVNSGNQFTAGNLTLSTNRDDIPITGPMFYTDSNSGGWSGTGFWAPGDNHTRGLFVKNTGSLDAKLSKVWAIPEATKGTSAYNDAITFANEATVTIAVYAPNGNFDQTAYRQLMDVVDNWYQNEEKNAINNAVANVDDYINQNFLNQVFHVKNVIGEDVSASVKQVWTGRMSDLLNGQDSQIKAPIVSSGTLLMGYTVSLPISAGDELQGKSVIFTFKNDFVQSRNNP